MQDGVAFRPRRLPAEDAAAFVQSRPDTVPEPYHVEVVVHADIETVRHAMVLMRPDRLERAALAVGVVGAECSVLSPPESTTLLDDRSRRFSRAGGDPAKRLHIDGAAGIA